MRVPQEVFRAYDIRGLVDEQIDDTFAYHLARSFGTYLIRHGASTCSVGYDVRESGPSYAREVEQGLRDSGIDVTNIGLVSTPISYFSVWTRHVDASVMITASHNPAEYNGFKLTFDSKKLSSASYQELCALMQEEDYEHGNGSTHTCDLTQEYMRVCLKDIRSDRSLRIVVDTGNGTAGLVLPQMLRSMGHDVIELFTEPDGTFPNHHPDPSDHENLESLQRTIADTKADLGLALDGDADRIAIVDEKGGLHHTDELIALFARELLDQRTGSIVYDVKCSKLVKDTIENHGGKAIESRTGHTFITPLVASSDALFGGEMSGHLFFNDRYFGYDDGIYSSCRIAELLSESEVALSELLLENPYISTPELKIRVPESKKFEIMDHIVENTKDLRPLTIDGVKIYRDDGWLLIRASNTSPYLIVRYESATKHGLEQLASLVSSILDPVLDEI